LDCKIKEKKLSSSLAQLEIDLDGIGHVLADKRLKVPTYQRSYAWTDDNVKELLTDIHAAMRDGAKEYFLGSILTQGKDNALEIVDGQQRLATTSILIAAIRDYLNSLDKDQASDVDKKYLQKRDIRTREVLPQLTLNADDNDFYQRFVLSNDKTAIVSGTKILESHERIRRAKRICREYIEIVAKPAADKPQICVDWLDFIEGHVKVIWVQVPDESNAFVIFETLNDRGVELSIADLLKNLLFGKADTRLAEVQNYWTQMIGTLASVGGDDILLTYIRHSWSSVYGLTREKQLFSSIKTKVTNKQKAVDFAKSLAINAALYAQMLNSRHERWAVHSATACNHMDTLSSLKLEQFRPLLLAVFGNFSKREIEKTLKYILSASVRFMIVGGLGGGALEKAYSDTAVRVSSKEIKTAKGIAEALSKTVPTDADFKSQFAIARVSKSNLARYYLSAIEKYRSQDLQPEFVPNINSDEINLEHVLPENPGKNWGKIAKEEADSLFTRIGNLALMKAKLNSTLGNTDFQTKKVELKKSTFKLSKEIGSNTNWGKFEIEKRQQKMADDAVKIWGIAIKS
jgi:hypothetical protein